MKALLALSRAIDALNETVGRLIYWLILAMVLISAANAISRYAFSMASNAWLELQWYLFAAVFLLASGYTLLHNEHIRIDIVSNLFSRRTRLWIDVFGAVFFLLPMSLYLMYSGWQPFLNAWTSGEVSASAGGLVRWPARLLIPIGFFLLSLQGISELIKRIAQIRGLIPDTMEKHEDPALEQLKVQEGTK